MLPSRLAPIISLVVVVAGCGGYFLAGSKKGFEATEMKRAAFDLQCTPDKVQVVELVESATPLTVGEVGKGGEGTVIGASGCGHQATYKWMSETGWVVQTAAKQQ